MYTEVSGGQGGQGDIMKLFIVEDSPIIYWRLVGLLKEIPGLELVGVAHGEQEAVEQIHATRPDVVLLDIQLTEGSGINVLRRLKVMPKHPRVLVLTSHTEGDYISRCSELGCDYFFDKAKDVDVVCALIERLASQQQSMSA